MNKILLLIGVSLLTGCDGTLNLTAIGARDASGARTGDYRIVNENMILAEGRFARGKKDGKWRYFDSRQITIAELTYRDGSASGPYRTYFGSAFHPAAAGKLESVGQLQGGQVVGRHIGYDASGKVFTDAFFGRNGVSRVTAGTQEQAKRTAVADEQLFVLEEKLIQPALR